MRLVCPRARPSAAPANPVFDPWSGPFTSRTPRFHNSMNDLWSDQVLASLSFQLNHETHPPKGANVTDCLVTSTPRWLRMIQHVL